MELEEEVKKILKFIDKHKFNFDSKLVQRAYDKQEQELKEMRTYIKHYEETTIKDKKRIEELEAKLKSRETTNLLEVVGVLMRNNTVLKELGIYEVMAADIDPIDALISISKEVIKKVEKA